MPQLVVWLRCGLNCVLDFFEIVRTHLSEFSSYFSLACAALVGNHGWQRKCSISRDLCTEATSWERTNVLCTSDSLWHFPIMVWLPDSFSQLRRHGEARRKCRYSTHHYKSKRKNNIDWRRRELWITYWGKFTSEASFWCMQLPACCPVTARKIMVFLIIYVRHSVSLERSAVLHENKPNWDTFLCS